MGLREQLLGRQLPHATVPLRMDFSAEVDRAEAELGQRVPEAYVEIKLRAIPPDDFQALVDAHQPTDEEREKGARWAVTFGPAVLEACVIDSDLAAEDWAFLMAQNHMAAGEVITLVHAAVAANDRSPDVLWGKGSAPTIS